MSDNLAESVRGLARGYAFHAETSQYRKVYREVARDLRRVLGELPEMPEPDPLRHEMWAALADWLDDMVGDSYRGSVVRSRALAVATAYLDADHA